MVFIVGLFIVGLFMVIGLFLGVFFGVVIICCIFFIKFIVCCVLFSVGFIFIWLFIVFVKMFMVFDLFGYMGFIWVGSEECVFYIDEIVLFLVLDFVKVFLKRFSLFNIVWGSLFLEVVGYFGVGVEDE